AADAAGDLVRQAAAGRLRRVLLLQEEGVGADPAARRADPGARGLHHARHPAGGDPARSHGRLAAGGLDRPGGDELLGRRLLGAGVRARLLADLYLRGRAEVAAGAGLPLDHRRLLAVPAAPDPAQPDAERDLYR